MFFSVLLECSGIREDWVCSLSSKVTVEVVEVEVVEVVGAVEVVEVVVEVVEVVEVEVVTMVAVVVVIQGVPQLGLVSQDVVVDVRLVGVIEVLESEKTKIRFH